MALSVSGKLTATGMVNRSNGPVQKTEREDGSRNLWNTGITLSPNGPCAMDYPSRLQVIDLTFDSLYQAYCYITLRMNGQKKLATWVKAAGTEMLRKVSPTALAACYPGGSDLRHTKILLVLIGLKRQQCPEFARLMTGKAPLTLGWTADPGSGTSEEGSPGTKVQSSAELPPGRAVYEQVLLSTWSQKAPTGPKGVWEVLKTCMQPDLKLRGDLERNPKVLLVTNDIFSIGGKFDTDVRPLTNFVLSPETVPTFWDALRKIDPRAYGIIFFMPLYAGWTDREKEDTVVEALCNGLQRVRDDWGWSCRVILVDDFNFRRKERRLPVRLRLAMTEPLRLNPIFHNAKEILPGEADFGSERSVSKQGLRHIVQAFTWSLPFVNLTLKWSSKVLPHPAIGLYPAAAPAAKSDTRSPVQEVRSVECSGQTAKRSLPLIEKPPKLTADDLSTSTSPDVSEGLSYRTSSDDDADVGDRNATNSGATGDSCFNICDSIGDTAGHAGTGFRAKSPGDDPLKIGKVAPNTAGAYCGKKKAPTTSSRIQGQDVDKREIAGAGEVVPPAGVGSDLFLEVGPLADVISPPLQSLGPVVTTNAELAVDVGDSKDDKVFRKIHSCDTSIRGDEGTNGSHKTPEPPLPSPCELSNHAVVHQENEECPISTRQRAAEADGEISSVKTPSFPESSADSPPGTPKSDHVPSSDTESGQACPTKVPNTVAGDPKGPKAQPVSTGVRASRSKMKVLRRRRSRNVSRGRRWPGSNCDTPPPTDTTPENKTSKDASTDCPDFGSPPPKLMKVASEPLHEVPLSFSPVVESQGTSNPMGMGMQAGAELPELRHTDTLSWLAELTKSTSSPGPSEASRTDSGSTNLDTICENLIGLIERGEGGTNDDLWNVATGVLDFEFDPSEPGASIAGETNNLDPSTQEQEPLNYPEWIPPVPTPMAVEDLAITRTPAPGSGVNHVTSDPPLTTSPVILSRATKISKPKKTKVASTQTFLAMPEDLDRQYYRSRRSLRRLCDHCMRQEAVDPTANPGVGASDPAPVPLMRPRATGYGVTPPMFPRNTARGQALMKALRHMLKKQPKST